MRDGMPSTSSRTDRSVLVPRSLPCFCSGGPLRVSPSVTLFLPYPSSPLSPLESALTRKPGLEGGVPPAVTWSTSRPYFFARDGSKPFTQAFAAGRRQWTRREIIGTLLVTRRVSPRARPPFPAIRMGSLCFQSFLFPSPITKRK